MLRARGGFGKAVRGIFPAVAAPRELKEGAAVHQPIEDGRGQGRIAQRAFPVGDDTVRCDERAESTLVAPVHEGLELIRGVGAHPARQEQVIQDQEVGIAGGLPEAVACRAFAHHKLCEEGVGLGVQHPVARAHRGLGRGLADEFAVLRERGGSRRGPVRLSLRLHRLEDRREPRLGYRLDGLVGARARSMAIAQACSRRVAG